MAPRRASRILSESDLALCLERVPWTLLERVPRHARLFVAERLKDPAASDAEILRRAGYRNGSGGKVPRLPSVEAALQAARTIVADETMTDAAHVVRRLRENDDFAWSRRDLAASNAALGLLGKATGAFEKRVRITFDDPTKALEQLRAMPKAERVRVLRDLLA